MHTGYSPIYESFYWTCIYGCTGTDCESEWEAGQAFLAHNCASAGIVSEPPC